MIIRLISQEIDRANKGRDLYKIIGGLGYQAFFDMPQRKLILNCNVMVSDAKNALAIYG